MPLDTKRMIATARLHLGETTAPAVLGNQWSDATLAQLLTEAQNSVAVEIMDLDEDYFGVYDELSLVAGSAVYDLPPSLAKFRYAEYIAGGVRVPLIEARVRDGDGSGPFSTPPSTLNQNSFVYALFGDQFHIDPAAPATVANAIRRWYIREPPALVYGKAAAGSANSITFQASTDANGIEPSDLDGYYLNSWLRIVGGTGAGQRRRITSYVGTTRVAGVSESFSPTPDTTSLYSLETAVPKPFDNALPLYAAIAAKGMFDEDPSHLQARLTPLWNRLVSVFESRSATPRAMGAFDPYDGVYPWEA